MKDIRLVFDKSYSNPIIFKAFLINFTTKANRQGWTWVDSFILNDTNIEYYFKAMKNHNQEKCMIRLAPNTRKMILEIEMTPVFYFDYCYEIQVK